MANQNLDDQKIEELREQLENERERVQSTIDNMPEPKLTDDLDNADQGALAVSYSSMETSANVKATLEQRLWAIEGALQRIEEGRYGTCVDCGREISIERLIQQPDVDRCLGCAQEQEGRAAGRG